QRPEFLDEIGRIGAHAPLVAVGADFALDVKVVQQDELPRQLVVVGGDIFAEQTKTRVAIALRQVAKNLVVGAVFLDDVNAVFDRAPVSNFCGNRVPGRAGPVWAQVGPDRTATIGLGSPRGHL